MLQNKPLNGVRVLDLTRLLPGPMCTLHLADMGADVIKIEDTGEGDYARWMGVEKPKNSGYFLAVNRNKRGITLDLRQEKGRDIFLQLAKTADVIIESFRPQVVDKLGIGYDTIKAINPRIVYCAITGYGQTGPYRDKAGHDLNYCGYSGVVDQTGLAGEAPAMSNFQIADLAGGTLSAAMGILAALYAVQKTGKGTYIDVSMTDCTLVHTVAALSTYVRETKTSPRGEDMLTGRLPNYRIYATADNRYMAMGALEPKFWQAFCQAIQRPDWLGLAWSTGHTATQLQQALTDLFASQTQQYWTDKLATVDCGVTPILTFEESLADPQIQARGVFIHAQHPTEGTVKQFAFPLKFSEYAFSIDRHAPLQGEHNQEVLRTLGYSEAEIIQLKTTGVI
ncbi:CaiB/BaiF CoA transferase family protein [Beggiatoa leptomitoformis]|uniref:CoA transferase n=1 Tax=Beggiatoa leptomitoformis TaxID=288004 RepID=A0A2N9YD09_9GAMM|nr:CaiB/BaiF CoA-transferase family protein [Beggiatoa leptomitoformis]ALG69201.1 CoA transferase [Beggiatoa leptomitoformis]AUI68368.1 CoA transferase [Beggiatoa leptomitoformis]